MNSPNSVPALWLNGSRWDRTWLFGTALVVPVTLGLVWGGMSSDALNLVVTLLAGGPHVFSTFLTTFLDPAYRRRHGWALLAIGLAIPLSVILLTRYCFPVLMSFFIFAASFHVLQQNAYLADAYRRRRGRPEPLTSRLLDYAVLFLSFYPIASAKLVRGEFMLGEIAILIPEVFKTRATVILVSTLFGASIIGWGVKSIREWSRGDLNMPKTGLIFLTATIAFLIPATASGSRLELAFQSVNAWHSLQYLGLTWLILKLRKDRGSCSSRFLERISGSGPATWLFYGLCLLFTAGLLTVIVLLKQLDPFRLTGMQYYYMSVFSVLFIHYAFDGYFFFASRQESADSRDVPFVLLTRRLREEPV